MRQHPVFLNPLKIGENIVVGAEARHLIKVLRVKTKTKLRAFDGQGNEAEAEIIDVQKTRLILNIKEIYLSENETKIEITLVQAILKGDKLSDVVKKATELGVKDILFFISHYSDLKTISENKLTRLRRVALEASKQSGRAVVPTIKFVAKLVDIKLENLSIVAHPYNANKLSNLNITDNKLAIIIGPEGGFADFEIAGLTKRGVKTISLGPRILRAETAGPALISAILIPNAI